MPSQIRTSAEILSVHRRTGAPAAQPSETDLQLVFADVHIAEPLPSSLPPIRLWNRFDQHGITMLIPLLSRLIPRTTSAPAHLFRFTASVPPGAAADAATVRRLLEARGPAGAALVEVGSVSRYRARSALAAQYAKRMPRSGGWVLLCDDAAHVHSPAGGQVRVLVHMQRHH